MAFRDLSLFFNETIWAEQIDTLPASKRFLYRCARIAYIQIKGFSDERLNQQAAALSYTFFLSIIPFLAVLFGLAQGFGFQDKAQEWIHSTFGEMINPDTLNEIIDVVKQTPTTALGAIGFLVLLWTVIKTLLNLERSFNRIWSVQNSRPLYRALAYYLSVVVVAPFLLAAATTLSAMGPETAIMQWIQNLPGIAVVKKIGLPIFFTWVAATLVYIFMVNTQVKISAAAIGGLVTSLLWNLLFFVYFSTQKFLLGNPIYGAFALLPVFLVALYMSWLIVLFGARVAFALQNENAFRRDKMAKVMGVRHRTSLGLLLLKKAAEAFHKGKPVRKTRHLARSLDIAPEVAENIVFRLEEGGIIHQVRDKDNPHAADRGIAPARALDTIYVKDVFNALDGGFDTTRLPEEALNGPFNEALNKAVEARDTALGELTVKDII